MKRIFLRPGKSVVVSDQELARADKAMELFGITPTAMAKLAAYDGDVTIGTNPVAAKAKAKKTGPKLVGVQTFRYRMGKAAREIQVATQGVSAVRSNEAADMVFGEPQQTEGPRKVI